MLSTTKITQSTEIKLDERFDQYVSIATTKYQNIFRTINLVYNLDILWKNDTKVISSNSYMSEMVNLI